MASIDDDCILLPGDIIEKSAGFALDAGCSATKVVYRSRLDYENGKPKDPKTNSSDGCVRVAIFTIGQTKEVIHFLADNCDITPEANNSTVAVTGMQATPFIDDINDKLNLKVQSLNEFECATKSLYYLLRNRPFHEIVIPNDKKAISDGMELVEKNKAFMESVLFKEENIEDLNDRSGNEETENRFPCLLGTIGSAFQIQKFTESGNSGIVDVSYLGGKQLCGVANLICRKVMPYDKIIEMVKEGDARKVDITAGDYATGKANDVYSMIPPETVCFVFGKLSTDEPDEFNKADILASWFEFACNSFARSARLVCQCEGVEYIFMSGSFCESSKARELLTLAWTAQMAIFDINHNTTTTSMHFLRRGGYMGALGAFLSSDKKMDNDSNSGHEASVEDAINGHCANIETESVDYSTNM